jgi:peptidoglycan glycosyltransferase
VYPVGANKPQTGQSAIGQFDVRATPLQMAMVAAGIANGGVVMKPYYVDEVQSADLDILDKTTPSELSRAVSATTANELTKLMVATVAEGTASPRRAASRASRRTPGTSRSHPPTTHRSRWP